MNRRRATIRAFTLLELLIATTMVAVLSASLYASLGIAFKARDTANRAVESTRKSGLALEIIQADLRSAVPPKTPGNSIPLAGPFVATSGAGIGGNGHDTLTFYSTVMDAEPSPGIGEIKEIEYSCDTSDSGDLVLVRRITTNLLAPVVPEPRQEILLRGIKTFTLSYFDGQTWQESWDSTLPLDPTSTTPSNMLPKAVEVTIELKDPSDSGGVGFRASRIITIPCGTDLAALEAAAEAASTGGTTP